MLVTTRLALERLHPDGADALARLDGAAWKSVDPVLLSLCGLAVAQLLGNEPARDALSYAVDPRKVEAMEDWGRSSYFTPAERAHLAFTEQFVFSVGDVTKEQVDALLEHASASEVHSFVAALYSVELAQRVDMVAGVVLGPEESHE
jgi:alkylhydroperoxidase family enzyme